MTTFNHDQPIHDLREDVLGRGGFAKALADAVKTSHGHPGMAIAVVGQWGDGKTSLKNLMLQHLEADRKEDKIFYLEFNPWHWSGNEDLQTVFFREIDRMVSKIQVKKKRKNVMQDRDILRDLSLHATRLNYSSYYDDLGRLNMVWAALVGLLLGTGIVTVKDPRLAWGYGVLLVVLVVFMVFRFLATTANNRLQAYKTSTDKTLEEAKGELESEMKQLSGQLVVSFDDLDRLNKDELKKVLQIIKANGNFPNITYLSFFDHTVVEDLLSENGHTGRHYLEKMFQVILSVPEVEAVELRRYFLLEMKKMLGQEYVAWAEVDQTYDQILRHHLTNLRRTKRFLNNLGFYLTQYKTASGFEISIEDLLLVETLKLYEPRAYDLLVQNAETLSIEVFRQTMPDQQKDVFQKMIEGAHHKVAMGKLLVLLFPLSYRQITALPNFEPLSRMLISVYRDQKELYRKFKLSHPFFFARYFTFTIQSHEVRKSEMDHLMRAHREGQNIDDNCVDYIRDGRIEKLLQGFEHFLTPNDHGFLLALTGAITRHHQELHVRELDRPAFNALILVYVAVLRAGKPSTNATLITAAIQASQASLLFQTLFCDRLKDRTTLIGQIDDNAMKQEGARVAASIHQASEEPDFLKQPRAALLMKFWHEHGDQEAFKAYWTQKINSYPDLLALMEVLVSTRIRSKEDPTPVGYGLDSELVKWIDPSVLLEQWKKLRPETLTLDEQILKVVFEKGEWMGDPAQLENGE